MFNKGDWVMQQHVFESDRKIEGLEEGGGGSDQGAQEAETNDGQFVRSHLQDDVGGVRLLTKCARDWMRACVCAIMYR